MKTSTKAPQSSPKRITKEKPSDSQSKCDLAALKAENLKLQRQIAKLKAENVTLNNRINIREEEKFTQPSEMTEAVSELAKRIIQRRELHEGAEKKKGN